MIDDAINGRKAALLEHERIMRQRLARAWRSAELELEGRIAALIAESAELPTITPATIARLQRYNQLLRDVRQQLAQFATIASDEIARGQADAVTIGLDMAQVGLSAQVNIIPNRLYAEAVQAMVTATLADGTPFAEHIGREAVVAGMMQTVVDALINGLSIGLNPNKVARQVQSAMSGGLDQAVRVARTEMMRAMRFAQIEQYTQSGVVEGYFRLATRDTRTCLACLLDDGSYYPLGQTMPEHPQGRCAMVPKVRARTAPTWKKGRDWFSSLSDTEQADIMGERRFQEWKQGKAPLSDMVRKSDTGLWGATIGVNPLPKE